MSDHVGITPGHPAIRGACHHPDLSARCGEKMFDPACDWTQQASVCVLYETEEVEMK